MKTHENQIIVCLDVAANKATPAIASMIARILADAGAMVSFGDDRCDNLEAKAVKSLEGLHVHIGKLTWAREPLFLYAVMNTTNKLGPNVPQTQEVLNAALHDAPLEPTASLSYGGISYEIPYTIMQLMVGWVALGAKGTYAPADQEAAARNMLENVAEKMRADALMPNAKDQPEGGMAR